MTRSYRRFAGLRLFISCLCLVVSIPRDVLPVGDESPLTLPEALRIADERNLQLQSVRQEEVIALGQVQQARSAALPHLNLSGSYTRIDDVSSIEFGDASFSMGQRNNYEVAAELQQVLYAGGGVRAAMSMALEYEGAVELQIEHTSQRTAFAVHAAFNRILLAGEHLAVAREGVLLADENLQNVNARIRQGLATDFDRLRAEAEVSRAGAGLIGAENALYTARLELFRLLEIPCGYQRDIGGELAYLPVDKDMDAALEKALTKRPDLIASRRMMNVRREAVKVARSGSSPKVVAYGRLQQSRPGRSFEDQWEDSWAVGMRIDFPLFDGLNTRGKTTQAEAEMRRAELEHQDLVAQVRLEIARAGADLATAEYLVESYAKRVSETEEALRLVRRAYEEGKQEQIDVITAQLALTDSRYQYAIAIYKHTMATRSWELALGELTHSADFNSESEQ